ncbi:MAG: hypothetical protein AAFY76_17850, partial [Cyanobacteria bacterium J06649_11]
MFTKELVFSLLSPDFENIGITSNSTNKPKSSETMQRKMSIDAVKKKPQSSDSPPSPSIENGGHNSISTVNNVEETHEEEDTEQKTDNNENAEISVTRTSINNELLGVASGGGGIPGDPLPGPSEGASNTSTDRMFRTKQPHRGASADVLTPDDGSLTRDTPR